MPSLHVPHHHAVHDRRRLRVATSPLSRGSCRTSRQFPRRTSLGNAWQTDGCEKSILFCDFVGSLLQSGLTRFKFCLGSLMLVLFLKFFGSFGDSDKFPLITFRIRVKRFSRDFETFSSLFGRFLQVGNERCDAGLDGLSQFIRCGRRGCCSSIGTAGKTETAHKCQQKPSSGLPDDDVGKGP